MCRCRGHYIELPSNIPYVTWNNLSNQITLDWLLLPLFWISHLASALAWQRLCNVGYDLAEADVFISCPCEDKASKSRAADDIWPCKKERSVLLLISCFSLTCYYGPKKLYCRGFNGGISKKDCNNEKNKKKKKNLKDGFGLWSLTLQGIWIGYPSSQKHFQSVLVSQNRSTSFLVVIKARSNCY